MHGERRGAKVYGDVSRLSNHLAVGIEQGAGVIAPFFDVGGEGAAAEGNTHLLCNRAQAMVEHLQRNRINAHA